MSATSRRATRKRMPQKGIHISLSLQLYTCNAYTGILRGCFFSFGTGHATHTACKIAGQRRTSEGQRSVVNRSTAASRLDRSWDASSALQGPSRRQTPSSRWTLALRHLRSVCIQP